MAQIDGAGQQDTDNQNTEALQAALAQRQVTLQDQPQGGSDVPSHENSDPVSDESEILGSVSLLPENVVYRGGHIAGIINPPGCKGNYGTREIKDADVSSPERWLQSARSTRAAGGPIGRPG